MITAKKPLAFTKSSDTTTTKSIPTKSIAPKKKMNTSILAKKAAYALVDKAKKQS